MDIAGSLKDVVREEGSLTRDVIREGLEGLGRQIGLQIDALGKRMEERMEERDKVWKSATRYGRARQAHGGKAWPDER